MSLPAISAAAFALINRAVKDDVARHVDEEPAVEPAKDAADSDDDGHYDSDEDADGHYDSDEDDGAADGDDKPSSPKP